MGSAVLGAESGGLGSSLTRRVGSGAVEGAWQSWSAGAATASGKALHHSKWKWETIKDGESLFIGWAVACLSVISEKLKLDSREWICFHDIFALDFSKCILGVSQRLFLKNKSYILFFQTSFIFDI